MTKTFARGLANICNGAFLRKKNWLKPKIFLVQSCQTSMMERFRFRGEKTVGKYVDRNFIKNLTEQYYQEQRNHVFKCNCICCQHYQNLVHEKKKWSFDGLNSLHNRWFFIFDKRSDLCLFPVFI